MNKWLRGPAGLDRQLEKQGWDQAKILLSAELARDSVGIARVVRLVVLRLNFFRLQVLIDECLDRRSVNKCRHRFEVALWRELYYVAQLVYLLIALFLVPWAHASAVPLWYLPALASIVYLVFFDMLLGVIGSAFVWGRYSLDPLRSLLLSLMNYAEATVAFAILYLFFDCLNVPSAKPLQALYFSAVTATTVGFGDLLPKGSNTVAPHSVALLLVMLQLAVSVLFALVLVNTFLARVVHESGNMALPKPLVTPSDEVMSGAVVFTGTQVPVQTLFDYLEEEDTLDHFLETFPAVSREHAVAVLELAKESVLAQADS